MAASHQITPEEELQTLARAEQEFQALALAAAEGDGDGLRDDLRAIAGEAGAAMLAAASAYTAEHSDDVVLIADAICDEMSIESPARADLLAAARLHDIGKTSIPLEVIEKAGPLTDDEWELMKGHTIAGQRILSAIPELTVVGTIVRHSHERWDGQGYPDGLAGEEIPLASRVIFCADAFDAIRCSRPYRDGRSAAESLVEVRRNAGTQFDPAVVEALIGVTRKLRLIPASRRTGNASRLASLLMIVAVGATGSAVASTGLLDSSGAAASERGAAVPALTKCVSFDCSGLLGVSLSDQFAAGDPRATDRRKAAGATSVGLGSGKAAVGPGDDAAGGATETSGPGQGSSGTAQAPAGAPGAGTPNSDVAPAGNDQGGDAQPQGGGNSGTSGTSGSGNSGSGSGSSGSNSGNSGSGSSGSGNGNSGHPHGGPPGQTGQHPQGGPPGQTGQHPQGGPPGQAPSSPSVAPQHPQGGPPGQAKKP